MPQGQYLSGMSKSQAFLKPQMILQRHLVLVHLLHTDCHYFITMSDMDRHTVHLYRDKSNTLTSQQEGARW